ncbi:cytidine deaminase [Angustibacter peucedani]
MPLPAVDAELLEAARTVIRQRFREGHHHVGAALRTTSGTVHAAVHLEATVGRIAVCAEAIALGMAAASGDTEVDTVVAVNAHGEVVAPCGMCRELVLDYAPSARVVLLVDGEPSVVTMSSLLPSKYRYEG